ncbi:DUF305 domain-containing protein [Nocardia huaxiensis]|uniref:DUF305 domain-containing protein n=1 Tax=Nocardia huaxiensis TaxID=2755382 RepID=A0A7D6ZLJ7_9NOCA|nr:DUF305 domain-containing protein [Nocardia huaxiensis]QLY32700.1 DUF305 domain-containing protein [Nocardia huaxiensis]
MTPSPAPRARRSTPAGTRRRWITGAALSSLALLLLVLGAAGRPLFITENPSPTPILDATEIGFAQDMLAHHQQALVIAQRLSPDADPMVRRLAQQISDSQRFEIGMLLGWLRLTNAGPTNSHPMVWMHGAGESTVTGHAHPATTSVASPATATMPGMASMTELDALSAASGLDAEILFLQLMQRHHYGGVAMAQAANALLTGGPVKLAARDMVTTQGQEIGFIGLLLTQRGGLG